MRQINRSFLFTLFFLLVSFGLHAKETIVKEWNNFTLSLIAQQGLPPTVASRILFEVHTAGYNAWTAYDCRAASTDRGITLRRPVEERTKSNKKEAFSYAAFRVLLNLFPTPTLQTQIANFFLSLGYNPANGSVDLTTAVGIGNVEGIDMINFRQNDGSNQLGNEPGGNGLPYSDYIGYVPTNTPSQLNNPNLWQPLLVQGVQQKYVTPFWGFVQPFALTSIAEFIPKSPATTPGRRYVTQAKEVLRLSAGLNDRTKSIAEYWADGGFTVTPPGHWNQIAQYASNLHDYKLDDDVKLFFALNSALLDAGIAVWNIKLLYNSERPITAIHYLFQDQLVRAWAGPDQGTQEILGQNWKSYIGTPSFPEYISGHSTFSAAAAEVLKLFTRSEKYGDSVVIPKGSSKIEPGVTPTHDVVLHWATFLDAANQAGISRRYGGIHFKQGDYTGRKLGKQIGEQAYDKAIDYIKVYGTANNDC